jgi:hypothetical protein
MRFRFFLPLLIALFALSACAPLTVESPPPAPQVVRVAFSSTLRPWMAVLHGCALETPQIALVVDEINLAYPVSVYDDLLFETHGHQYGGVVVMGPVCHEAKEHV